MVDGLAAYAFMTTNVGHFADARIPEETIVRLSPGDYPFVKVPTVIDLTRPEVEQREGHRRCGSLIDADRSKG